MSLGHYFNSSGDFISSLHCSPMLSFFIVNLIDIHKYGNSFLTPVIYMS